MKLFLVLTVAMLLAVPAFAGFDSKYTVDVVYNPDGSGTADGVLSNTRFTDDDQAFIGCRLSAAKGDPGPQLLCYALEPDGVTFGACFSQDPALIAVAQGATSYGYVQFDWDPIGECTHVIVAARSQYIPDFRDLGLGAPGNSAGRGR